MNAAITANCSGRAANMLNLLHHSLKKIKPPDFADPEKSVARLQPYQSALQQKTGIDYNTSQNFAGRQIF
jgi:hypothetical protein